MKHSKFIPVSLAAVTLGALLIGAGPVSAHGFGGFGWGFPTQTPDQIAARQQAMFDQQATLLGLSVNDIKDAWAAGKSIPDLIKEKGLNQDQIQARATATQKAQLKSQLDALVSKGVVTQAQADLRLQTMQTRLDQAKGRRGFGGGMMRGFRGGHFGF